MTRSAPRKTLLYYLLFAVLVSTPAIAERDWQAEGHAAIARARQLARPAARARNVILFVGDGMGVSTVTAARILEGQLRGESGEENQLAFETLPYVALAKTYNTNQQVPDSAGTMTAMVTGVKTLSGVLSVGPATQRGDHKSVATHQLPTLFEIAESRGLATGVVSTATITHATPAACYAHSPERSWENDTKLSETARNDGFPDIARQLIEFSAGDGLEVAMGGGRANFLPNSMPDPEHQGTMGGRADGRDLMEAWRSGRPGSVAVWTADQLEALDLASVSRILGLFEPSHMNFEAHRLRDPGGEPDLATLTSTALEILERNPAGYVLMVEGGRIDHGHHASSAYLALHDAIAFSDAVARALEQIDLSDTLVVVTADHSHVFTIAGYPTRGNDILGLVRRNAANGTPSQELMRDASGLPYTTLGYTNGPGHPARSEQQAAGPKRFPHFPQHFENSAARPDLARVETNDPFYLQESSIPMKSETHSGEDVAIYAGGPGSALFHGVQEQSFVYYAIAEALGWHDPPARSWFQRWLRR